MLIFISVLTPYEVGYASFSSQTTPVPETMDVVPEPTVIPEINSYQNSANISFREIGLPQIIDLHYPSSADIYIDFPDRWLIAGGGYSYIDLHYDLIDPNVEAGLTDPSLHQFPRVEVYINDTFVNTFVPLNGKEHYIRIDIPSSVLLSPQTNNPNNEFDIRFEYEANWDDFCEYQGVLTIYDTSSFIINFVNTEPIRFSLNEYSKILLHNSFIQETLLFVIPDEFNDTDLDAVVNITEDITNKSFSNINWSVVKASQVTTDLLSKSSIILVGSPSRNSFLATIYEQSIFPSTLSPTLEIQYQEQILKENEGLLQLVPSPYNAQFYLMTVTGNSDLGIERAYSSLINPTPAMVSNFHIEKEDVSPLYQISENNLAEILFSDLSIREKTFYGIGEHQSFIPFFVPRNWEIGPDSALVINYAHSVNLSPTNSSISVALNNKMLGSIPIEKNAVGDQQFIIPIKKENLKFGAMNVFVLNSIVTAPIECAEYRPNAHWLAIRDSSFLYLPHNIITDMEDLGPLSHPLYYLAYQPNLLISLPESPSIETVTNLTKLVALIGKLSPLDMQFQVTTSPDLPKESLTTNELIIGQPSTNPQVRSYNDQLPQKFSDQDDKLVESIGNIPYRIPNDISIGLIEVLPNVDESNYGVTIVSGTSPEGLQWALNAITVPDNQYVMNGDLFYIYEDKVLGFQSQMPIRDTLDMIITNMSETPTPLEEIQVEEVDEMISTVIDQYTPTESDTWKENLKTIRNYSLTGIVLIGISLAIFTITKTTRGGRRR